jgi:pantoate--beta-alanine ligase
MGALHAGHASLIERARRECDTVIVTVFVNPRQFNDATDLARYPRTLDADVALSAAAGADVVVAPELAAMWPDGAATATTVHVAGVADELEGEGRPGHFDGVASVVAKILLVTGPCRAYFGLKDFQQLAVVSRMVRDLAVPVELVGCEIVRDDDGLALSSRNVRLSVEGRARALALSRAVRDAAHSDDDPAEIEARAHATMVEAGVEVAYAAVRDAQTLAPLAPGFTGEARILVAGTIEGVRLIDNGPVTITSAEGD